MNINNIAPYYLLTVGGIIVSGTLLQGPTGKVNLENKYKTLTNSLGRFKFFFCLLDH